MTQFCDKCTSDCVIFRAIPTQHKLTQTKGHKTKYYVYIIRTIKDDSNTQRTV